MQSEVSGSRMVLNGNGNGNGNGKGKGDALLIRLTVELTRLAQGRDQELDCLLEPLRVSLRRGALGSDFKDAAGRFLKYIVSGYIECSGDLELSIKALAVDLLSAIEGCFPAVRQISLLKEELARGVSIKEVVASLEKITPILSEIAQVLPASGDNYRGQAGLAQVLDIVCPKLGRVLDRLGLLEPEDQRVASVRAGLTRIASLDELEVVLGEALGLVVDIATKIDQERQHTEQFLGQLRLHLKSMEEGIAAVVDVETSLKNIDRIQSEISGEVLGIESAVFGSDDLDVLKRAVGSSLERLSLCMESFVEAEKEQLEAAKDKIDELTRQARVVDAEVEHLRHQLIQKQQMSVLDPLTGVDNRGGFDRRIEEEMARSLRIGFPLALLVVDIDKFKLVNDTFGHKAGDMVLQTVAKLMKARVRDTDYIARYGGDEFVLLLPGTTDDEAKVVAQTFCEGVKRCGFHSRGREVGVTLSIGIAQLIQGDTAASLFDRADTAMYAVKGKGRDGCGMADKQYLSADEHSAFR